LTFIQLIYNNRPHRKVYKIRYKALRSCPQKKGTCVRVAKIAPKKPNSANRSYARVILSTYQRVNCHIPGETHNLHKFSIVLVRGGRVPDIPGVKYKLIHGAKGYGLSGLLKRKSSRSRYGTKNFKRLHLDPPIPPEDFL